MGFAPIPLSFVWSVATISTVSESLVVGKPPSREDLMRFVLIALFFATSAFAQNPTAALPPACGPENVAFKVKLDSSQHALARPEPGKALVYFIQDDGPFGNHQHYTMKIGLDGAWVGAYKQNSYFTVSLEPGEHHICANVQSDSFIPSLLSLAHFSAELGRVYFFHTKYLAGIPGSAVPYLDLDPVDSDQAKYLIATSPLSVWHSYQQQAQRHEIPRDTR